MKRWSLPLLCLVACSGTDDPPDLGVGSGLDASVDAGTPGDSGSEDLGTADAGGPHCEVGTGADVFEPLTEGQVVALTLGPQGGGRYRGYHIWSAVRVSGVAHQRVAARFELIHVRTSSVVGSSDRMFNLQPSGDAYVAYGVAPWISDCCLLRNEAVRMRVDLTDSRGARCVAEQTVTAADRCPDPDGRDICP